MRCAINVLQGNNEKSGPDIRPNVAGGKGPPGRAKGRQGGARGCQLGQIFVNLGEIRACDPGRIFSMF